MMERNRSDCKHVEILPTALAAQAHRAEGQCLLEGHALNVEKSMYISSRNTKINIFQDGSAGFKATIDLKKNEAHQGDVYF
jgi:hypothetical protein